MLDPAPLTPSKGQPMLGVIIVLGLLVSGVACIVGLLMLALKWAIERLAEDDEIEAAEWGD